MIANYYVGNTDWAHQNWYASFNRIDPDGSWRFHSWDAEKGMQGANDNVTGRDDSRRTDPPAAAPCLECGYRLLFADHAHRHFFNGGKLTPGNAAPSTSGGRIRSTTRSAPSPRGGATRER
ncbi:MAG: hypothetical protein R3F11_23855 [Verrucomicrobiales bacterium]